MSAYIVNDDTLDLLVTAALQGAPGSRGLRVWHADTVYQWGDSGADSLGAILAAANRDSVNYRYQEDEIEHVYRYNGAGIPGYLGGPVIPWGHVLSSLDCYEYQACEHPEWETSLARAVCDAIRRKVCDRIQDDDAPWGWTREHAATRMAAIRDKVNGDRT